MLPGKLAPEFDRRAGGVRRVYAVDLLWRAVRRFIAVQGNFAAAAISYYALLSLIPFLIFLVTVFGLVVQNPAAQERVTNAITSQVPADANLREQVRKTVRSVSKANSGLVGLFALVGAAWTASGMFSALRRGLNRAFGVPMGRSFIRGRLLDLGGVAVVSLLVLLSTTLTAVLGLFRAVAGDRFHHPLANLAWGAVYLLVPLATSFSVFLVLYRIGPNLRLRLGDIWLGALVAAVGFELAKAGMGLYLARFGNFSAVYGALGGVVAFMVFVFLAVNIVIFAAGLAAERAHDRARARGERRGGR